jgi:hypothetical protein
MPSPRGGAGGVAPAIAAGTRARRARSRGCVAEFGPGVNADEDITRIDVRLRA